MGCVPTKDGGVYRQVQIYDGVRIGTTGELFYQGAWHSFEVTACRDDPEHPHYIHYPDNPAWNEYLRLDVPSGLWHKRGLTSRTIRSVRGPNDQVQNNYQPPVQNNYQANNRSPDYKTNWTKDEMKEVFNAAKHGRIDDLRRFIERGAPIDCTPFGSQSPLYIACFYGKDECVRYLCSKGAQMSKVEKDGYTPAHAASSEGHLGALKILKEQGANVDYITNSGQTCKSLAINSNHQHILKWLDPTWDSTTKKKNWSKDDCKAVFNAAKKGRLAELKRLIERGAPIDCTPFGSQTPCYIAAFYGQDACLRYLISKGADIDRTEKDGFTAAHAASSEGHLGALKILAGAGGNMKYETKGGSSTLTLAKKANHAEIVAWLKTNYFTEVQTDVYHNNWTKTECKDVFNASKHGRIEELKRLIGFGAPVDCTPFGSQTPCYIAAFYGKVECLEFLIDQGASLNKTEKDGFTPAHAAASEGHLPTLKVLKNRGANMEFATKSGQTCYSLAKKAGHTEIMKWLKPDAGVLKYHTNWSKEECKDVFNAAKHGRLEQLKSYLTNGAPVDCHPFGSQTPCYIAAFYGKIDCLNYMIKQGADIHRTEKDGYTAAHAAASQGQLAALQALDAAGADLDFATNSGQTCLTLARDQKKKNCAEWLEGRRERIKAEKEAQKNAGPKSTSDQLKEVAELYGQGLLTLDEFKAAKNRILGISTHPPQYGAAPNYAPPPVYNSDPLAPPQYNPPPVQNQNNQASSNANPPAPPAYSNATAPDAPPAYDDAINY